LGWREGGGWKLEEEKQQTGERNREKKSENLP